MTDKIQVAKQATITHQFAEESGQWVVVLTINGTPYAMESDDAANLGAQLQITARAADREQDAAARRYEIDEENERRRGPSEDEL